MAGEGAGGQKNASLTMIIHERAARDSGGKYSVRWAVRSVATNPGSRRRNVSASQHSVVMGPLYRSAGFVRDRAYREMDLREAGSLATGPSSQTRPNLQTSMNPTAEPLVRAPQQAPRELARIQIDTIVGMGFSNVIALFIMLTTAATLNAHGVKDIQTSSQAAEALRPIAGDFAFAIFALGIVGTGLLTLPVLAGSAAYAVGEALQWRVGLTQHHGRAKAFYGVIAAATLVGAVLNFTPLDNIKALFFGAPSSTASRRCRSW
jgi:Natural resistance-associated macrophage protein